MLIELILTILTAIIAAYWFLIKPLNHWKKRGITYLKGYPIVGNLFSHAFKRISIGENIIQVYNAYPDKKFYGIFLFSAPTILIRDVQMIKDIFIKDFEYFGDHSNSIFLDGVNPIIDRALFILKGSKWRDMRATLSPAFTGSKMRIMFQLLSECCEDFVNHFIDEIKMNNNGKPLKVELKEICSRLTNDIIASTAFGIKINSLKDPNNEFYRMGRKLGNFATWRMLLNTFLPQVARFFKIGMLPNEPLQFLRNMILDNIRIRERDNIYRPDMVHLLIEAKNGSLKQDDSKDEINNGFAIVEESKFIQTNSKKIDLDDDDMAAHAFGFFLAGFENISIGMCFAIYELAINSHIQERLYIENEKVLNENNGKLNYNILNKMKYLDMVMSETLRKWSVATFLDRTCIKPYTIQMENGKTITLEKGTVLTFPVWGLHYDPKYFPEPEKFDPERFSDENKDKIKTLSYLPFGGGPRGCIGTRFALMELKTAIFYIIKYFEIYPNEKSMIPPKPSTKRLNLTLENGFHVTFKIRK